MKQGLIETAAMLVFVFFALTIGTVQGFAQQPTLTLVASTPAPIPAPDSEGRISKLEAGDYLELFGVLGDYLVTIDQTTGDATAIAAIPGFSYTFIEGLTFDSDSDTLFGVADSFTDPKLITINRATGQTTVVGPIDPIDGDFRMAEALAFNPADGLLYGSGGTTFPRSDKLITVDPTTGVATQIGSIIGTIDNEVDALIFIDDVLYAVDARGTSSFFYSIDRTTGAATLIGQIGFKNVNDLAFNLDTQTLFGFDPSSRLLITISTSTGQGIAVGTTHTAEEFDGQIMTGLSVALARSSIALNIVSEARLDIGMPYSTNRGCSSPYSGCGGPFHGFYAGVCTDLAMDAYDSGVPFKVQDALFQDHLAHLGRYQYATARWVEDMRRYFQYNQSLLAHDQPYQVGDVAFFDWHHVGIISEVDAGERPLRFVHATGVCSVNPSGLAFEQDWNSYYDQHIQGHGRLGGLNPLATSMGEAIQILRISTSPPSVALRLRDANGKTTSDTHDENLVASNVEAFIPYIPGGSYSDLGTEKIITITQPLSNTTQYFVELTGLAAATYNLRIETLQDSSVTHSQLFTQAIASGETHGSTIALSAPGSTITFEAAFPAVSPMADIPNALDLTGLAGTSAQVRFAIAETGGQQPWQDIVAFTTDFMDQNGGIITSTLFAISPNSFSIPTGGSQNVNLQIDLAGLLPGMYLGSLVLGSTNGGTNMIPITLEIEFRNQYLPLVLRNHW